MTHETDLAAGPAPARQDDLDGSSAVAAPPTVGRPAAPGDPGGVRPAGDGPAVAAGAGPAAGGGTEPASRLSVVVGLLFWVGIGLAVALYNDSARPVVLKWWWGGALAVLVVVVALLIPPVQRRLTLLTPAKRAGLFIFVVMPLVVLAVASVAALPARWQTISLRTVFVVVVCLLPAAMWYLFIANQKASLLNEYLANLQRLGLLRHEGGGGDPQSDPDRTRRVSGYLQKFEAVYGPLSPGVFDDVLADQPRIYSRSDADATTPLATTTVPVLLSTVLVTLGWLVTLPFQVPDAQALLPDGAPETADWAQALSPVSTPATFAFLGAYFFSLQMIFRRYLLKDLHGSAYVATSMRLILAVIGIWVLARVAGELLWTSSWQILTIAFVVGVFPRVLWQIMETLFTRVTSVAVPSLQAGLPLTDLDGLTVWHETRLEEEDIENVPNMATADIPGLLVSTPYPPERVIDWVDQAILLTQLGPAEARGSTGRTDEVSTRLRALGIRSASALVAAAGSDGGAEVHRALHPDAAPAATAALLATLRHNQNLGLVMTWKRQGWPAAGGD